MDAELGQRLRMRFDQLAELVRSPVMPLGEIAGASSQTARARLSRWRHSHPLR